MKKHLLTTAVFFSLGAFALPLAAFANAPDGFGSDQEEKEFVEELDLDAEINAKLVAEQDLIARIEARIADLGNAQDQATASAILAKIKKNQSPAKRERMLTKLSQLMGKEPEKRARILGKIRQKHIENQQGARTASSAHTGARAAASGSKAGARGKAPDVAAGARAPGDFAAGAVAGAKGNPSGTASAAAGNDAPPPDVFDDLAAGKTPKNNSVAERDESYDEDTSAESAALIKSLCMEAGGTFDAGRKKCVFTQAQADKLNSEQSGGGSSGGGGGGGGGLKDLLKGLKPEDMSKMIQQFTQALSGSQKTCIVNAGKKPVKGKSAVQDCVDTIGGMK